jgi:hypothetical protein
MVTFSIRADTSYFMHDFTQFMQIFFRALPPVRSGLKQIALERKRTCSRRLYQAELEFTRDCEDSYPLGTDDDSSHGPPSEMYFVSAIPEN